MAMGKVAVQSSTSGAYTAGRAVDGDKGTDMIYHTCTYTSEEVEVYMPFDCSLVFPFCSSMYARDHSFCGF